MSKKITNLTINADDFGLHPSIDQAIVELVELGIVKAVSILVTSPNLDLESLNKLSKLDVSLGIHLAFTEMPRARVDLHTPGWTLADGKFLGHWRNLRLKIIAKSFPQEHIYQEWKTQILLLSKLIPKIDYIDSHQNLHLLPGFIGVAKQLRSEFGIPKIRIFADKLRYNRIIACGVCLTRRSALKFDWALPTFGMFESANLDVEKFKAIVLDGKSKYESFVVVVHPGKEEACSLPAGLYVPPYKLDWKKEYEMLKEAALHNWLKENSILCNKL